LDLFPILLEKQKKKDKISLTSEENPVYINKHLSNSFVWCPLWRQRLYCYHFLPPLNMNQVPEKLNISWSVTPKKKNYQVNAIWLLQQNQCRIKFIISSLSKQKYIGKLLWKWLQYVLSKADGFHTYSLVNPQYRQDVLQTLNWFYPPFFFAFPAKWEIDPIWFKKKKKNSLH
jgi:hypothetical protein